MSLASYLVASTIHGYIKSNKIDNVFVDHRYPGCGSICSMHAPSPSLSFSASTIPCGLSSITIVVLSHLCPPNVVNSPFGACQRRQLLCASKQFHFRRIHSRIVLEFSVTPAVWIEHLYWNWDCISFRLTSSTAILTSTDSSECPSHSLNWGTDHTSWVWWSEWVGAEVWVSYLTQSVSYPLKTKLPPAS